MSGFFRINLDGESWVSWLAKITEPNSYAESCAWLYCDKPFSDDHTVFVFPVKNVGKKGCTVYDSFAPDKEDFSRVKAIAKERKLTNIGNVHTHVAVSTYVTDRGALTRNLALDHVLSVDPEEVEDLCEYGLPSSLDLAFARRFNQLLRCIVTVYYPKSYAVGRIFSVVWHDQFGNILKQTVAKSIEGLEIELVG